MKRILLVPGLLVCAAAAALADPVSYQVDPNAAKINYTVSGNVHTVHGTFRLKNGAFQFDPGSGKLQGEIVVDAASGNSGSGARDGRMKKSILEVDKYPEIRFTPDRVEGTVAPQGTSKVQVHGSFWIHGAAHELTVPAEVESSAGQMTVSLKFEIPYVAWGMKNPSTLFLRVEDKVTIEMRVAATARP
jgi:polyisoprenoid-binding protein YceI